MSTRNASRPLFLSLSAALWCAASVSAAPCAAQAQAEQAAPARDTFAGTATPFVELTKPLLSASATSMKPVGTSSLVFKFALKGGVDAAFKPATKKHPEGYVAEVWAYGVARALGLTNVVPVVIRTFGLEELKTLLRGRYRDRWSSYEEELVVRNGKVSGALIHWVRGLRELGLDGEAGVARWSAWLSQAEPVPQEPQARELASQISSMLAFDYLIGNWDRFSGANAQGNADGNVLYLRDHNVAFESLSKSQHARLLQRLRRAQRFSRSFVEQLKALNREGIERAVQGVRDATSLREGQWAALEERRLTLLSYVAALIEQYGEARVLAFP